MKAIAAASLVAAQLVTAAPAFAADLVAGSDPAQVRMGAFAGARFRVELGGRHDGRARIGLALAPTSHSQSADGRVSLRYAEGFEFGVTGREPARLRLAGYRIGPGGSLSDGRDPRLGISTLGAAGIAGGVIVVGFLVLALAYRSDGCCE
jgi:hypothetical protein